MYRYRRFENENIEILEKMDEKLRSDVNGKDAETLMAFIASEEGKDLGYIKATKGASGDILRIRSIKTLDMPQIMFSEVLECLARILIVEARMTGEYERVVVAPPEDLAKFFEEWGFIGNDDPNDPGLEYYLNECMGYCPSCRRC